MKRYLGISFVTFCSLLLVAGLAFAKPSETFDVAPVEDGESYVVGDVDGTLPVSKVLQDTVWIADWNFDGVSCNSTGWVKYDNRILNNGVQYWTVSTAHAGTGGIVNNAAVLSKHDLCWVSTDGYANDWDQSIILKYQGATTLSFDFISDSEPGFDFVTVECDSLGLSESRVNYSVNPAATPEEFRTVVFTTDGLQSAGLVSGLGLTNFGAGTHEAYIRFESDGGFSDEDGDYPTFWGAGLVVDGISVSGGLTYSENFEGALNANVSFANTAPATPFGQWARLFQHITDNDKCTENTTCAWLGTDPLKLAFFPSMGFGPGGAIIRNWLDDVYVSPWVSLTSTPGATGTVLSFRRFPGNTFALGKIVQGWRVRGKARVDNTDTSAGGDSIDCVSPWGHASQFNSLTLYNWVTSFFDMSTNFDPTSTEIQLSFRNGDWQVIAHDPAPLTVNTGPGPYLDRVRIGRRILSGPVINVGIDTRTQAQDCFPTVQNSITPGQHHSPAASDIFGTCAFSEGTELGINSPGSPNLITGDSILVDNVVDARNIGGITSVSLCAAITSGPHVGKAPSPYTVGSNGFFCVAADSSKNSSGVVVVGRWFVDMDDTYFRGGDQVKYFWYATDFIGGGTSAPAGITAPSFPPASASAAEIATGGLYEVNYLPTIDWDPSYLTDIQNHATGDIDPTPAQQTATEARGWNASGQKNCILYYQHVTSNRRSGPTNRTSFMYTLDRLGYAGDYDVYDVQGYGNTNNQLGGRGNVAQCTNYALIIEDDGRSNLVPNITNGTSNDNEKVNQLQWYRDYLGQGLTGGAGIANLWVVGENTAFERAGAALIQTDLGLASVTDNQGLASNPDVEGVANFTFTTGNTAAVTGDKYSLAGGCPAIRAYDMATPGGTAVGTHKYRTPAGGAFSTGFALVMNKNNVLKWNTVWTGHGWFDIRDVGSVIPGPAPGTAEVTLAGKVLNAVLPCVESTDPTDNGEDPEVAAPPRSNLRQNVPNPFNPTTKIVFDLARDGRVKLQVFDVAGKLVKTLVNANLNRKYGHEVVWNGLDEAGQRVPSGVYFYQLVTDDMTATKKMVMLK